SFPARCGNLPPDPPAGAANLRPRQFQTWLEMSAACAPTMWPATGERYREGLSCGIAPAAGEDDRGLCCYDGCSQNPPWILFTQGSHRRFPQISSISKLDAGKAETDSPFAALNHLWTWRVEMLTGGFGSRLTGRFWLNRQSTLCLTTLF